MSEEMKWEKVAYIDGCGDSAEVHLYEEDRDGETRDLPWPKEWPTDWVSVEFLISQGFKVSAM